MAIHYIDEVFIYQTEEELYSLIEHFKPDIRILGEDYIGKGFTGDNLPPKVIYTSRAHDWSTTKLKDLITKQTINNLLPQSSLSSIISNNSRGSESYDMKKIRKYMSEITSVDIVLISALCLYGAFLIINLSKLFV